MKKRFTDEQIIGFLKEAEAGTSVKELCRKHGFSDAAFHGWRSRFGGMEVADAARLRNLESENGRLKKSLCTQPKAAKADSTGRRDTGLRARF
jgi:putative transposase